VHTIEPLQLPVSARDFEGLCGLLADAIENGASVGFMKPIVNDEIAAYWRRVIADMVDGNRLIWVARNGAAAAIIGSAQLSIETRSNGRHRAEVQKVIVLARCRRRGLATELMAGVENAARMRRLTLLFLDTSVGPGGACAFYEGLGYSRAGGIPGYALDPDGTPAPNAIYYKVLP
jgi:acetyltransferase